MEYMPGIDELVYPHKKGALTPAERSKIAALEHTNLRLVDCVPEDDLEQVRDAIFRDLISLEIIEQVFAH